jgi:hypothetical protein
VVLLNLPDGGPSHSRPLLGPSKSIQGGTPGTNTHQAWFSYIDYIRCYMLFVQGVEMEPAYQKQNGHENLVLTLWVRSELTSYKATC